MAAAETVPVEEAADENEELDECQEPASKRQRVEEKSAFDHPGKVSVWLYIIISVIVIETKMPSGPKCRTATCRL